MENIPAFVKIIFILTTVLTLFLYYSSTNRSFNSLLVPISWLTIQYYIAQTGFYTITDTLPPRMLLLVGPPFVLIALLFLTKNGRQYIDSLEVKTLTLLHSVRVPVEMVLFWLFIHKAVPQIMTFEGQNLDIISGLTAPFVYYFGYIRKSQSRNFLLVWNFICLGLLINIVATAILSAPTPIQQLAFGQPNIAVLHFPFIWLPCFIVPVVLFSHLVAIRELWKK